MVLKKKQIEADVASEEGLSEDKRLLDFNLSLGNILRDAREEKKVQFDEISRKLCIQHGYLKAMEEGRIKDLPGEPYRSSFIKSYASFLQLNSDELLQEYRDFYYTTGQVYNFPEPLEEIKTPKTSWLLLSVIAILFLCLSFYFLTREDPNIGNFLTAIPERLLM